MTSRRAAISALALLLAACASTPDAASQTAREGCWYFVRDAAADALHLPWGVRLQADALDPRWAAAARGDHVRQAATLTPDGDAGHPFAYWLEASGDSIEVGYPAGGGLVLILEVRPDTLAGTATPVGDAVEPGAPPRSSRAVRLTRARCPSS